MRRIPRSTEDVTIEEEPMRTRLRRRARENENDKVPRKFRRLAQEEDVTIVAEPQRMRRWRKVSQPEDAPASADIPRSADNRDAWILQDIGVVKSGMLRVKRLMEQQQAAIEETSRRNGEVLMLVADTERQLDALDRAVQL